MLACIGKGGHVYEGRLRAHCFGIQWIMVPCMTCSGAGTERSDLLMAAVAQKCKVHRASGLTYFPINACAAAAKCAPVQKQVGQSEYGKKSSVLSGQDTLYACLAAV